MTRLRVDALEDSGNTADGCIPVRYTTHSQGVVWTASTALGGTGAGALTLSAGTSSAALGSVVFSNSNNVSFGLNGSTVTGSVPPPGGVSAGTASVQLGTVVLSNSNGVSFGLNGSTVTAQHNALTSQSNQALSAANGSFTFQTATFANSNGVSFSTGTQGLYASHNGLTSQSNQQMSLYAVGNTTQSTSGTQGAASLSFRGEGVASVGVSNGSVVVSVPAGGGGGIQSAEVNGSLFAPATLGFSNSNNVSFSRTGSTIIATAAIFASAGTSSAALSSIVFSNSNGVSFGLNGSTVTASVSVASADIISFYASGATNTENKLSFINSNGISFGLGGAGNSQITASHNGLTSQSNQAASASNGSFAFQTLGFSNANNVTFGTSAGNIITASVAAPGGGAGATVGQWPENPWPMAMSSVALGTTGNTGGSTQITASVTFAPFVVPVAVTFGQVIAQASFQTVAGTGSASVGFNVGIYSLNGNTLSQLSSWMWQANISQNSVTAQSWSWWSGSTTGVSQSSLGGNVSATFTQIADLVFANKGAVSTLTAGQYWVAAVYTRRSSNADVWNTVGFGNYSVSQFTAAPVFGSNTIGPPYHSIHGLATNYTTNTNAINVPLLPSSLATSVINLRTGGSSNNRWPILKLLPGT